MFSRRFKIIFLITTISFSLIIMLFFVFQNFANNRNLNQVKKDYDVKVEDMNNTDENLNSEIIKNAISIEYLNKTIKIVLENNGSTSEPTIIYKVEFDKQSFQYIFLSMIIKTFPQWKTNNFIFKFNILSNAAWVQYDTDSQVDYLDWYFKIVSKI
ncbi:hypothetical protein [Spiroplasma sp. AdecLV25b]|uniref:hypothetical protein n=1 Tax=Spiroplasma sp. AdecLV25b TaxID=3027162 RepID=UPI0027DF69E9|nr:hypothetical protein [Spiroplasma sp. AdecLV25b]